MTNPVSEDRTFEELVLKALESHASMLLRRPTPSIWNAFPNPVPADQTRAEAHRTAVLAAHQRVCKERDDARKKYELLAAAVNETPDTCDAGCDREGHNATGYLAPGKAEARLDRIDMKAAEAALAEGEAQGFVDWEVLKQPRPRRTP